MVSPRACNLPASDHGWSPLALALALMNEGEAQAREHARLRFARTEGLDTCPSEEDLRGAVVARLGYALRIRALRSAGRADDADRAAKVFLARYPRSLFRPTVMP